MELKGETILFFELIIYTTEYKWYKIQNVGKGKSKSFLTHPQATQSFCPEITTVVIFPGALPVAFYIESASK